MAKRTNRPPRGRYNPGMASLRNAIVQYLARRGVSQRSIARLLRIDRGTVLSVLRSRPLPGEIGLVVVRRCPSCGGLATWPCRLCSTKRGIHNASR